MAPPREFPPRPDDRFVRRAVMTGNVDGAPVDRSEVAVALMRELHAAVGQASERFDDLMSEVTERSALVGRDISLHLADGTPLTGRARGCGEDGELLLETADGTRAIANADRVRLCP